MGDAALVDAAAIVATFNAIDRVADSTGIPIEDGKAAATADSVQRSASTRSRKIAARSPTAIESRPRSVDPATERATADHGATPRMMGNVKWKTAPRGVFAVAQRTAVMRLLTDSG